MSAQRHPRQLLRLHPWCIPPSVRHSGSGVASSGDALESARMPWRLAHGSQMPSLTNPPQLQLSQRAHLRNLSETPEPECSCIQGVDPTFSCTNAHSASTGSHMPGWTARKAGARLAEEFTPSGPARCIPPSVRHFGHSHPSSIRHAVARRVALRGFGVLLKHSHTNTF